MMVAQPRLRVLRRQCIFNLPRCRRAASHAAPKHSKPDTSSSIDASQKASSSRLWTLLWFGNAVLITHLFLTHVASLRPTSGPSMLPTFQNQGDFALLSFPHRRGRWLKAGDIISFDNPVRGPRYRNIKRIMGMPGDFVLRDTPSDSGEQVMIQVPEGHVWVMGDNLEWSRDSRHFGPLPMALIRGKVMAVLGTGAGSSWRWVAGSPFSDVT